MSWAGLIYARHFLSIPAEGPRFDRIDYVGPQSGSNDMERKVEALMTEKSNIQTALHDVKSFKETAIQNIGARVLNHL